MPALPVLLLVTSFYFTRKIEANREPLSYVSISRCIYLSTSHLPSFFPFVLGSSSTWALGSTPPTFPGTDHYPSQQLLNLLKPLINKIKDWIHRIAGVSSRGAIDHGLQLTVLASFEIRCFLAIVFKLGIIGLNPNFTH